MKIEFIESLLLCPKTKPFLILNNEIVTYGDFLVLLSKTISFLEKNDKDYIFINAEKNQFTLAAYFASQKLGKISCFIDPLTKSPEKYTKLAEKNFFYFSNSNYKEVLSSKLFPLKDGNQTFFNPLSEVIFTTGTTGSPKGVLLSHQTIYKTAKNINLFTGLKNSDVEMHMMPISHSFGLARIRCSILKGNTIILMNGFGNLISFYDNLEKHNGTVISTVPAGINFLIKLSKEKLTDFKSQIRMMELGSSPMTKKEKINLANLLPNSDICMHYGLTEASRATFLNFKDEMKYIDSVGKQSYGSKIKIFNNVGQECSINEPGEICIKGSNLFSGYIFCDKNPSFYNNYFRTGDFGYINKKGYLFFEGREDDLINIAGKKISPLEIEKYINEVEYIKESACIPIENSKNNLTEIRAFVVIKKHDSFELLSKEIKKYLKNKIEYYKIPSTFINIDEIPKTKNGKILKNKLKDY